MPYTVGDEDAASQIYYATWLPISEVSSFVRTLVRTDYSVVASRRDAHAELSNLLDRVGRTQEGFLRSSFDVRIPSGITSKWLSTLDTTTEALIQSLAVNLSFRTDNLTKEGAVAKGAEGVGQVTSDNTKRFEELAKQFAALARSKDHIWDRRKVENYAGLVWTDPVAPAAAAAVPAVAGPAGPAGRPPP